MKQGIHPKTQQIEATCACGAVFVFDSTSPEIRTEVCSNCHPFYTGKQKLLDTAGKVDKFRARMAAAKISKPSKKKSKIADSVKEAAATRSKISTSAVDTKRAVGKVKDAGKKREITAAKVAEEKATKAKEEAAVIEAAVEKPAE
ncbi:MAG: 50S ribosomal protein L31 [Candidatus Gracilibacteria bacterium]|nr:50S ribosomal protein L31 [Candidatus Gracilibacteria bacterium]MDD5179357.1 50S ribosomal protein L31 [Candidatus Gracilibacteria bacterium]